MRKISFYMLFSFWFASSFSQHIVRGKVSDKDTKEPIEFAVISIGEKARSTLTDGSGNFKINVPKDSPAVYISFVGYHSQMVNVKNRSPTTNHISREGEHGFEGGNHYVTE